MPVEFVLGPSGILADAPGGGAACGSLVGGGGPGLSAGILVARGCMGGAGSGVGRVGLGSMSSRLTESSASGRDTAAPANQPHSDPQRAYIQPSVTLKSGAT